MNRKITAVMFLAVAGGLRGLAGALIYDEAAERVTLGEGAQKIEFKWDAKANGFVTQRGDWIAWDTGANGWLMVPKTGARARFDAAGNFLGSEKPPVAAQPKPVKPAVVGYDPTADAGDSGAGGQGDTKAAFDYLSKRDAALAGRSTNSVAGDAGGPALANDSLGGDAVARRKQMREQFKLRPGAHANDPDGVLETGAVKDPLQALMESMQSLSAMARGVESTIENVNDLDKQIRHFDDPNFVAPPNKQPTPSDNNPLPPAAGGAGQGVPPGGGYPQQPGYGQQPGLGQSTFGGNPFGGFGGGVGGYGGGGGNIGGKPPANPNQPPPAGGAQSAPGSRIIPQGAVPQGGVQGIQNQAAP